MKKVEQWEFEERFFFVKKYDQFWMGKAQPAKKLPVELGEKKEVNNF